jgi:hypothetical protein
MDDSAHGTRGLGLDLALLAASGLLPDEWAHDPAGGTTPRVTTTPRPTTTPSPTSTPGPTSEPTSDSTARPGVDSRSEPSAEPSSEDSAEHAGATGAAQDDAFTGRAVPADHKSYLPDLFAEASWSAIEAGGLLGIDPDAAPRALDWLRRAGVVIGLPRPSGTVYPRFQFDPASRRVRRVVAVVNVWLGTAGDPYTAAVWWLRPGADGLRPRDLLGTPDEGRIVEFAAARISGRVHGARVAPDAGSGGRGRVIGGLASLDPVPEKPTSVIEPAMTKPAVPPPSQGAPTPIEPIPRGNGIFGRRPRHA